MKKALVTGATGFIGSYLAKALKDSGYRVRLLSRRGLKYESSLNTVDYEGVQGDIIDSNTLAAACEGVDIVFHAAGLANDSSSDKNEITLTNLTGTKNLYSAAVLSEVAKFVFFSSVMAAQHTESEYANSKWNAENYLLAGGKVNPKTKVIIIRPAIVYGPGMHGNISTFLRLAKNRFFPALPLIKSTFSMISVQDLCRAAIALENAEPTSNPVRIFIITDGEQYTPNRVEESVYSSVSRALPKLRLPISLLFFASVVAEVADNLGIKRNSLGLRFYKRFNQSQTILEDANSIRYRIKPTTTLEKEMPRIIESLELE